jgi:hypothetical protein
MSASAPRALRSLPKRSTPSTAGSTHSAALARRMPGARADSWPRIPSFLTDALGASLGADPLHVALSEIGHS